MEAVFGADLSQVRVHTDEAAHEGARKVGAEAYTAGKDVYFAHSRDPEAGHDELLAHELTHVLQQQGDREGALGASGGAAEREAEHAARKVREGERPKPIRKRRDGAVHRAEKKSDEPRVVDKGAHVKFTAAQWEKIKAAAQTDDNKLLKQRIAELRKLEDVAGAAKDEVWDVPGKKFRARQFVPMPFPAAEYLPHRSVTGSVQIQAGDYFVRQGGAREDDGAQSQLASLIKDLPPRLGEFSASVRGELTPPTKKEAWDAYSSRKEWIDALGERHSEPKFRNDTPTETTVSQWNLTLNRDGFNMLWDVHNYRYWPSANEWRRLPAKAVEAAADDDTVDPAVLATLVSNYQAHHVIPLWLRSQSGRSDGDKLENLAPWHKDVHQTNHAAHHTKVPTLVADATRVTDYRDFKAGTPFLVSEWEQGNRAMSEVGDPPAVRLDGTTWRRAKGKAIWLGD